MTDGHDFLSNQRFARKGDRLLRPMQSGSRCLRVEHAPGMKSVKGNPHAVEGWYLYEWGPKRAAERICRHDDNEDGNWARTQRLIHLDGDS